MTEPNPNSAEEFTPTRDHEYQDAHYHDEEIDIVNDEKVGHVPDAPAPRKKNRIPPPKRRYYED
jgi:hypothetical protein